MPPATAAPGGVAEDDDRELQPLRLVDAHNLHSAPGGRAGLALSRSTVLQASDVLEKITHADQAAGVSVAQQLVDVAHRPLLPRLEERGSVGGLVQERLEEIAHLCAARHGVQLADQGDGARGSFVGDRVAAVTPAGGRSWVDGRDRPGTKGEIRLAPKDVPEGDAVTAGRRLVPRLRQAVDGRVGEGHGRRAEQTDQGQVIGRVGQGPEGVEQVADLGSVVEPAPGHRQVGHPDPV